MEIEQLEFVPLTRSIKERTAMVRQYDKLGSAPEVIKIWHTLGFGTAPPNEDTILAYRKKFEETGSVQDKPRSGRPTTVLTPVAKGRIRDSVHLTPIKPIVERARELDISPTSLHRGLTSLKIKAYRCQKVHGYHDDDQPNRLRFCRKWIPKLEDDVFLADLIWFSDESFFSLGGTVNTRNLYYFAEQNPHFHIPATFSRKGLWVWCAISSYGIIGPHFCAEHHTGEAYRNMLGAHFFAQAALSVGGNDYYFQQDGAGEHRAGLTVEYLNEQLPGRWIGRGGPHDWPPRSPDLTVCDFFLWGYLKDKVFLREHRTVLELEASIRREVAAVPIEMCERACRSFIDRLRECERADGGQFEI